MNKVNEFTFNIYEELLTTRYAAHGTGQGIVDQDGAVFVIKYEKGMISKFLTIKDIHLLNQWDKNPFKILTILPGNLLFISEKLKRRGDRWQFSRIACSLWFRVCLTDEGLMTENKCKLNDQFKLGMNKTVKKY